MPKNPDLQKHTLNLFVGDYEKLQLLFPQQGAGPIIRQILHDFIARCEASDTRPSDTPINI